MRLIERFPAHDRRSGDGSERISRIGAACRRGVCTPCAFRSRRCPRIAGPCTFGQRVVTVTARRCCIGRAPSPTQGDG